MYIDPIEFYKKERHRINCRKWNAKNPTYSTILRKSKRSDMTPAELAKDKERVKKDSRNARARKLGYKDYQEYLIYKENKLHTTKMKDINKQIKSAHQQEQRRIEKENYKIVRSEKLKEKRKTDLQYKLIDNLRCRTRKILRVQSARKYTAMAMLIGLSGRELNEYLFPNGKPDYEFHIDHIIPISKFDLKNKDHQFVALYYKNLQILPIKENLSKHAALPDGWRYLVVTICRERKIRSEKIIDYIKSVSKC